MIGNCRPELWAPHASLLVYPSAYIRGLDSLLIATSIRLLILAGAADGLSLTA